MSETAVFGSVAPAGFEERGLVALADYGLLADRCSAALVAPDGSIDWLCLPWYDSPPIFDRILDPQGGHWSIRPVDDFVSEWRYLLGTLVLETTFRTATGVARLTDAMLVGGDGLSPHEVVRSVEGLSGEVELLMELASRTEHLTRVAVRSGVSIEVDDAGVGASFTVRVGERVGFSLCWIPTDVRVAPEPTPPTAVAARIEETVWRSWAEAHDISAGTHRRLTEMRIHLLERDAVRELAGASL
jgi:hypothetical protein